VQGLCALLFGICYHFNREPGEITRSVTLPSLGCLQFIVYDRKTLHPIITRLGADHLVARMARVREDDRFRLVTPESIVLPLHPSLMTPSGVTEGEVWLDWGFVEFWKANYCEFTSSVKTFSLREQQIRCKEVSRQIQIPFLPGQVCGGSWHRSCLIMTCPSR
jgi:hypothetical protein